MYKEMTTYNKLDSINFLPRKEQSTIFQLRTGHTPLLNYHLNKINSTQLPLCRHCAHPFETVNHILFECPSLIHLRQTLLPLQPNITNTLYGRDEQLKKTAHYFFLGTVCKRAHSSAAIKLARRRRKGQVAQPVATLKVDNVTVSLDECNIQLTAATHWIEWCVTGLSSPILTLNISATTLQSQSECIRYTYTNSSSERNPINLSVSYLELDGCRRTNRTYCFLNSHIGDSVTEVVHLNPYTKQSYSGCQEKFIDGLDRYIYNGTLDTTSQDLSRRQIVYFEMQTSSLTGYYIVCQVSIYPNCDNTDTLGACYCRNVQHSKVELILNLTATMRFSNGTLRILWPQFGSSSDISNEELIPITYAQPVATLKVDNVHVSLDTCDFQLTTTHLIEWCVTGLHSYILTLNVSSTGLRSHNECIKFTYTFSSSECSPINFSVSYLELDGRRRANRKSCFLDIPVEEMQ
ncbi:uncharacterized protein LOC106053177 isoform X4 [Biomphalaria glabrata]|uniref:Uncharacterized protein LOC106053177 isoform X4 n=1 Tax=Biomphalaria glabrata TaxID=6526 RepID=A0A9W2YUA8_BIOGL|nr:uncharacterized protein LOC106053177 isoform X4 [Biomphalaria glabrata]